MMKKIVCALVCLVLVLLCTAALADIELTAANFPDAHFREYLSKEWDSNRNGVIESKEMRSLVYANDMNISSLKGIELLQSVTILCCRNNQLTSIDISKNTGLTQLECGNNPLPSLDVSKNKALIRLECTECQITSLNVKNNANLEWLQCFGNKLTKIDVSHNTKLEYFTCSTNKISKLDVTHNPNLVTLQCGKNQLTELDVTHNPYLVNLWCGNNKIRRLDLSKNPMLGKLVCNANPLSELDISNCPKLQALVRGKAAKTHEKYGPGWWTYRESTTLKQALFIDKTVRLIVGNVNTKLVTSIKLNKTAVSLKKGKTLQLKVKKILPADAKNKKVTWTSDMEEVAVVDLTSGKVTAKQKGECTITCTAADGSDTIATCKIKVK